MGWTTTGAEGGADRLPVRIARRLLGRPRLVAPYRAELPQVTLDAADAALERLLEENLLGFWDERLIDPAGGYRLDIGPSGRLGPARERWVVTQARTTWFFSRLARSQYGRQGHLEWAAHGFDYLRERMWDREHGGFFWEVGPGGPTDDSKHLYGQAFGLLALAEFSRAAGSAAACELGQEAFELIDRRAHDERFGGYFESRRRDWGEACTGVTSPLGFRPGAKAANTNLHLMSALSALVEAAPSDGSRMRLRELVEVVGRRAVCADPATYPDRHAEDWRPAPGWRTDYGHDVETVWLTMEACRTLGDADADLLPVWEAIWANTLEHGFDHARGGIYDHGEPGRPAGGRHKSWWPQAEGLVSSRLMHRRTGDPRYEQAFLRILDWILRAQADWEVGDWHGAIAPDWTATGAKAGAWSCPFHQGRALLTCLDRH
jgi:mannobiose 2-epimerase